MTSIAIARIGKNIERAIKKRSKGVDSFAVYLDEKRLDTASENNDDDFISLLRLFIALSIVIALPTIVIGIVIALSQS